MSLGIIPELEYDCLPRAGELVVCWVDHVKRFLGAAEHSGGSESVRGPWGAFRHRAATGYADFYVGDIVLLVSVPSDVDGRGEDEKGK